MKRYIVLSLLLASTVRLNASTDLSRRDGNWWTGETETFKLAYVAGFYDGMDLGNRFSYWDLLKEDTMKSCLSRVSTSFSTYEQKYMGNTTNSQLVDGLDSFYSDYRNRRIVLPSAVWLVVNGIAGMPQKDLDKMIESWRKNSAN